MTDDPRPRATADRDVDLAALAVEIGDDRLALAEDGRTVVYVGDDDTVDLAAAVAAHAPPDPDPEDEVDVRTLARALVASGAVTRRQLRDAVRPARADRR